VNLAHTRVLIVWCLSSIPNLVQIYDTVTEIDAFMLQNFIDDVTRINFRFRPLVSGHLRMAVMHYPMKFDADTFIQSGVIAHFSEIQDGGGRHLVF